MTDHDRDRLDACTTDTTRVLITNPVSGSGDHTQEIRTRGSERGFDVHETTAAGDARRLARTAVERGASIVAVAGGDGTVNEVVHGLVEADALEAVDLAVIPVGTANLFAKECGIDDVDRAFEMVDRGATRRVDVGFAGGRPFLNTCLVGISAEANAATPGALKRRFGMFAYVLTTVRVLPEYEGVPVRVSIEREPQTEETEQTEEWTGTALLVLIGNAFRLPTVPGPNRPSAVDGLLEVTILETRPPGGLLDEEIRSRLFEGELSPITRREASAVSISGRENRPLPVSLDGELFVTHTLDVSIRERCLSVYVDEAADR